MRATPPPVHVTGKGGWKGATPQRDGRRGYMRREGDRAGCGMEGVGACVDVGGKRGN